MRCLTPLFCIFSVILKIDLANASATCLRPTQSSRFHVDTDGGATANNSQTYQSTQSYQGSFGGTVNPNKFYGAVNIDGTNGLTAGDVICYTIGALTKCGGLFDNGFLNFGSVGKDSKGNTKPPRSFCSSSRSPRS